MMNTDLSGARDTGLTSSEARKEEDVKPKYDETRNRPSDLDGSGYSSKSYRPGYSTEKSLQECDETDLKRGFKKGY